MPEPSLREYRGLFKLSLYFRLARGVLGDMDQANAKLVEAVWRYSPRNVSLLSRVTGIPRSTLTYRVERLFRTGLKVIPVVRIAHMGLEEVYIRAKPLPGRLVDAYRRLDTDLTSMIAISLSPDVRIHAWIYTLRGRYEPVLRLLESLKKLGLVEEYTKDVISDSALTTVISSNHYDPRIPGYVYKWDEWVSRVIEAPEDPRIVVEPKEVEEVLDPLDFVVLRMLFEDPMMDYVEMGRRTGLNYQTLRYHYLKHIKGRGSLVGWASMIFAVPVEEAYYLSVTIDFTGEEEANKFINAMYDTPLVIKVFKVKREERFITHMLLPKSEGVKFMWFMEQLNKMGFITRYDTSILIPETIEFKRPPLRPPHELKPILEKLGSVEEQA